MRNNPALATKLAEQFGAICDDLIGAGVHRGDISYALSTTLAILCKMNGIPVDDACALIKTTITSVYIADDEAQAMKRGN
jgi:hypothetical protein